jgi:hypothetical protein
VMVNWRFQFCRWFIWMNLKLVWDHVWMFNSFGFV